MLELIAVGEEKGTILPLTMDAHLELPFSKSS